MTEIISLLSGSWHWVIGIAAAVTALWVSYKGGKKIGTVETQAKADVTAAEKQEQQTKQASQHQAEIIKVVKDVQQSNQSESDADARSRMRQSKYNSQD